LVLVDLPVRAWRSPPVRAVRKHPVTRFVSRRFGSGMIVGGLVAGGMVLLGFGPRAIVRWAGLAAAVVAAFVNTPVGRAAEDRIAEGLSDGWRSVRSNLIPGVLGWVLWAFRQLAGLVERALYTVDEWTRFRAGQSEGSLALKIVFAAVWFPIAYLTRFAFYLLLEPQINPLKHFPVVTVSHKLLLPMVPSVSSATGFNEGTVFLIIGGIPGIFGFIAWELKENWRLYAANRPVTATPAILGHHGETMRGLLRPGFHSGTVPKLFARLRQAIRDTETSGRPAPLGRWEHELEEIAASVAATANRELVPLLQSSECWAESPPQVGRVRVGVRAIELGFTLAAASGSPLRLTFEIENGHVTARVADLGWAGGLSPDQQTVLGTGLGGLAELFAATWSVDPTVAAAVPAFATELRPRPWEHRARYWEACAKNTVRTNC
jgi:hypothetical protein